MLIGITQGIFNIIRNKRRGGVRTYLHPWPESSIKYPDQDRVKHLKNKSCWNFLAFFSTKFIHVKMITQNYNLSFIRQKGFWGSWICPKIFVHQRHSWSWAGRRLSKLFSRFAEFSCHPDTLRPCMSIRWQQQYREWTFFHLDKSYWQSWLL